VPLFFMVGLHGSRAERIRAAFFLFVFTLVGSTFL
jgi:NADH:ubiquinone oxidoreductase subunit 4 (subunit M)